MKTFKKLLAVLVAMTMIMAMGMTVAAGTITVENATYGKTYTAYKIFDAKYSGSAVSYTTPKANASKLDNSIFGWSTAADANGNISVWKLETASDDDVINWVKSNYSQFDSTGKEGTFNTDNYTVNFADMADGYYYVTSTLGSAIAINTAKPDATIQDKNASAPTDPEKSIIAVDGTAAAQVTEANAHVGSVVKFQITGNATNWTTTVAEDGTVSATKNTTYTFEDTYENLTVDSTSFSVSVNGAAAADGTYTVSDDGNGKISVTIKLTDADGKALYEAKTENSAYIPVIFEYEGTLTPSAADEPATNSVGDEIVKIYTYAFQVAKTDDSNQPLAGAQFELRKDGTALKFIDNGDGTYTYSESGSVTTLDMTTNTTIVIKGLDNTWSYTLVETKVPDGYNQAEDKAIAGSSLTKVEENTDTTPSSTALYKETIVNKQGTVLPSTGGVGTTIFYVVGAVLVLGAGVLMVTRRRMSN